MTPSDKLERHSALLLAATFAGHAGNYAYHWISGRLLPETEYGLMMALFGLVNLLLLPMAALGLALTRAVSADLAAHGGAGLNRLFRRWGTGLAATAAVWMGLAFLSTPALQALLGFDRVAPVLLAAAIPALNLFLVLNGAGLQGAQLFRGLALRGALLFATRGLLVGGCLLLGFRAAGWALLAHVLGMLTALAFGLRVWIAHMPTVGPETEPPQPVWGPALRAAPVLLAFSALMTADVILARRLFDPVTAGRFAQAATLARMILWLPLPIAQAMFPKVVRADAPSAGQARTLRKALLYTALLVGGALGACVIGARWGLWLLYGAAEPGPEQIAWLRGVALAMAALGPVHLLLQYELARGRILRLLPVCLCAAGYLAAVTLLRPDPAGLVRTLQIACVLALAASLPLVRAGEWAEPGA